MRTHSNWPLKRHNNNMLYSHIKSRASTLFTCDYNVAINVNHTQSHITTKSFRVKIKILVSYTIYMYSKIIGKMEQ